MRKKTTKKQDKNLLVGLDIGTSKVVAVVGEIDEDGQLTIISISNHPSRGLKRGVVVNIEATVASIQSAVEEAENSAQCQIQSTYTGISGSHIRSLNSHGIVAIRDNEVSQADVDRVIDAARAVAIPADQKILHVLPQEYIIDQQEGIREPVGMSGVRLEAKVHIVTGAVSAAQNIIKCVQRCGLEVTDVMLQQLASSYAVLTEDERELGVCLVDIGAGTTDIAIFVNGAIRHTVVIPIAGDQVTADIAIALRTPTHSAEAIKTQYASALAEEVSSEELLEVDGVGERLMRKMSRKLLAEVVEARYEELFTLIKGELRRSGFEHAIPAGIVLTGGGAGIANGLILAESVFKMPVRLGVPIGVAGLAQLINNPAYATGVGLLLYGQQQLASGVTDSFSKSGVKGIFTRMKQWFGSNF